MNSSQLARSTARRHVRAVLIRSRPRFWLYLAGPVLVGAAFGAGSVADLAAPSLLVVAGYFLVPANLFLYGVNDVFDAEIDARNPKKADRERRWHEDRVETVAVALAGMAGMVTFVVTSAIAWPYLAGFFVLAIAYSTPPLRLKTTPLLDSLSNGLYILPGAATYAAVAGAHPPTAALLGAWAWTAGMHALSAIPDIDPDRAAGIATIATTLGATRTFAFCVVSWLTAAVAFASLDVRLGFVLAVYPVLAAWLAATEVEIRRAYWWFPVVNVAVGTTLTLAGLSRLGGLP